MFNEKWKKICIEKHKFIEEKVEIWKEIEEEVGKDPFRLIYVFLDQDSEENDNERQISEALASLKRSLPNFQPL